jgi:hypothetical protein
MSFKAAIEKLWTAVRITLANNAVEVERGDPPVPLYP